MSLNKKHASVKSAVQTYLATTKPCLGGPKCSTCSHPKASEINEAVLSFNESRKTGATAIPWTMFTKDFLLKKLDYTGGVRRIKYHMEKCLGQEAV